MRAKTIFTFVSVISALSFGAVGLATAQDLLPRDNGIYRYHTPPRWRESESHPLRIAAYLTHPLGWALRESLFRPFSAFAASTPFTRSFFGYREPYDYRETLCFSSSDAVPDCRQLPPYTNIGRYREPELVSGGVGEDDGVLMDGGRQVFFPDVNFQFDKAGLNDLGKGRVRQIAQLLASVPSLNIVVEGHADYLGSDEYNQSLGERRANSVIAELGELGIDPARLSPLSFGESKPIFTEEEDWARAVNRRVQFSVQGEASLAPEEESVGDAATLEPAATP